MIGKRRWRVSVAADGKAVDSQRRFAENDHRAGIEVSVHGVEVVEDDPAARACPLENKMIARAREAESWTC